VAAIFFSCGFLSEKFVDFVDVKERERESSVFWSSVRVRHSLDAVAMVGEVHNGHAGDFPVQKHDIKPFSYIAPKKKIMSLFSYLIRRLRSLSQVATM
jgi:hypothetical protein